MIPFSSCRTFFEFLGTVLISILSRATEKFFSASALVIGSKVVVPKSTSSTKGLRISQQWCENILVEVIKEGPEWQHQSVFDQQYPDQTSQAPPFQAMPLKQRLDVNPSKEIDFDGKLLDPP